MHQNKLAEAEPLISRALHIHEEVLGARHSDTATSLSGLAGLLLVQGKQTEAELLFRCALGMAT